MKILKIVKMFLMLISISIASCVADGGGDNAYDGYSLNMLSIEVAYPTDYVEYESEVSDKPVKIKDIDKGYSYTTTVGADGRASVELTNGRYLVQYSAQHDDAIFNATANQVLIADSDVELSLNAVYSKVGALVIKEIYCGGCMRAPEEGTYQYDKYVTLYNNSAEVVYLDGLCYGVLDPYNSQANNIWTTVDPSGDYVYLAQAIWQFGGDGTTFPLQPGEEAVICNNGAIDHRSQYPLSVNLNREDHFVLYDNVLFNHTSYHPAPGDKISPSRYLNVVVKLGVANGWTLSVYSPAPVFFRVEDMSIEDFVADTQYVFQKPGSVVDRVAKVPVEWIVDGVDVFFGGSSTNTKRFGAAVDGGYVLHSGLYDGKSLHRRVDEVATAAAGYTVLVDTNNSTNDFYEREEASLRDE